MTDKSYEGCNMARPDDSGPWRNPSAKADRLDKVVDFVRHNCGSRSAVEDGLNISSEFRDIWLAIADLQAIVMPSPARGVENRPVKATFGSKDGVYICCVEMADGTFVNGEFLPATDCESFVGEYDVEALHAALSGISEG